MSIRSSIVTAIKLDYYCEQLNQSSILLVRITNADNAKKILENEPSG